MNPGSRRPANGFVPGLGFIFEIGWRRAAQRRATGERRGGRFYKFRDHGERVVGALAPDPRQSLTSLVAEPLSSPRLVSAESVDAGRLESNPPAVVPWCCHCCCPWTLALLHTLPPPSPRGTLLCPPQRALIRRSWWILHASLHLNRVASIARLAYRRPSPSPRRILLGLHLSPSYAHDPDADGPLAIIHDCDRLKRMTSGYTHQQRPRSIS